jgi:ABC-2 type transport system permease protein
MMKMLTFAKRCAKEMLRDPLNLAFGLGFPLVLLVLLSTIQANIPVSLFEIDTLAPGITVFGLSFMSLFSATLVAKDRESAFLQRLYTTPLTGADFIFGYMLPMLPIALGQTAVCFLFSIALGLTVSVNIVYAILGIIPMAIFNIALGLLCGSVLGVKQVGGICGALLTNLSAWLSGVWFDLELVGGLFRKIAYALPFVHAAEMEKALFRGQFASALTHLLPVLLYSALLTAAAVLCFLRQMKKQ